MPPLGECKSRIQYYKPEPCEAEIEACLSRPPLLPAPQFWVTLSVSGATWASFLPWKRPLSFSPRYHTQTSSLFFSLREIKTAFSPPRSFCSSIQIYPALIGRDDTHTALELGSKMVYNVCCQRVFAVLFIQRYIFALHIQSLHYLNTKWNTPQTS